METNELFSLRVEKHVLGGILNHPEIFSELDNFLSENDFCNKVHSVIFLCLKEKLNKNDKVDKVILSEKIKSLGISFKDEISIFDYIESVAFTQISKEAVIEAAQHLVSLRIRREIVQTTDKIKSKVFQSSDQPIQEVLNDIDKIYGEKVNSYNVHEQPKNLFDGLDALVEERGENIVDDP